jgi:hypothetical protein
LSDLDKLNGTPLDTISIAATNMALSPSDNVTELFGATGNAMFRINVYDGSMTPIAGPWTITVIVFTSIVWLMIFMIRVVVGIGVQFR